MKNRKMTSAAISEWLWMLLMAIYMGMILNLPVFLRKAPGADSKFGWTLLTADIFFAFFSSWAFLTSAGLFGKKMLKVCSGVMLIVSSVAAYYMWDFRVVIGYGIIQATFGTELSLVAESVGYQVIIFVLLLGAIPAYFFLSKPIKANPPWVKRYFIRTIFVLIAFVGLKSIDMYYKSFRHPLEDGRQPTNPFGVAAHSYLPTNWITASGMAMANYAVNQELRKNLTDPTSLYDFTEQIDLTDVYLVFVIGESARNDRMSLMGAERETTPLLQAEKNVLAFKGISCNTTTKLSLDCMFVREGGVEEKGDPVQQFIHEKNIFNVLKEFGFSIDLFAMQSEVGSYNKFSPDRYKIREEIAAESTVAGADVAAIDDYLLVDQVRKSITDHPHGKHIVLLHTKGSHFLYTNRYPQQFAKFFPECSSIDANCSKDEMLNSYDNSILYTDYVLEALIGVLRDKKALLIYVSDHGESIDDNRHFHGTPKNIAPPEQREIPFILWASDAFLEVPQLALRFEAARENQGLGKKVRHEEIFESILGCLAYTSSDGGIRPANNWCSPNENSGTQ